MDVRYALKPLCTTLCELFIRSYLFISFRRQSFPYPNCLPEQARQLWMFEELLDSPGRQRNRRNRCKHCKKDTKTERLKKILNSVGGVLRIVFIRGNIGSTRRNIYKKPQKRTKRSSNRAATGDT